MAGIPGLTITSQGSNPLPQNGSISFAGGAPLQISGNQIAPDTSSSGGGSQTKQNGGWYNGQQYWAPGQGPQTSGQSAQQSGPPDQNAQIDAAYGGEMGFLQGLQPQLAQQRDAATAAANQQYTGQQKSITDQLGQLNGQLNMDRSNFGQSMNTAYSGAQQQYNQLLQRNLAMYGGGSSAGPAIAAILGQGYQQQTGQLSNQDMQGNQQLQQQQGNISQWGDTQNNQLDMWHSQALDQVKSSYANAMNDVNQRIGMTEDAKAQAKLQILQTYMNQNQQLSDYKNQLQAFMQAYQTATPGTMGMQQFQPGAYPTTMNQLTQGISQTANQLPQQMNVQAPQQQANPSGIGFVNFGQQNNNQNQNQLGF